MTAFCWGGPGVLLRRPLASEVSLGLAILCLLLFGITCVGSSAREGCHHEGPDKREEPTRHQLWLPIPAEAEIGWDLVGRVGPLGLLWDRSLWEELPAGGETAKWGPGPD